MLSILFNIVQPDAIACMRACRGVDKMKEEIEKAIEDIRPYLQADGGDVELVDVSSNGVVKVKLTGACGGCPMSQITLTQGVERAIKKKVIGVKKVVSV